MVINMKKIFSILISLLFVASVFGIASVMAGDDCHCDGTDVIIPAQVKVGQEYLLKTRVGCGGSVTVVGGGNPGDYITQVGSAWREGDMDVSKWIALKVGTLNYCPSCPPTNCKTITITPKSYPMFSFMKLLGFGKKD